ncbi:MAG TPA: M1 family aminopeptidase [Bacteroidales bacterium]|nr:M1 family aminopeptidase [Bacteroidales bacterium]HRX98141.1 M1 family aminopeptidase [Bacteroidales bacterium]
MKRSKILLSLALALYSVLGSGQLIHHEINAKLDIPENKITVVDQVTIPAIVAADQGSISFFLNKNLDLKISSGSVALKPSDGKESDQLYKEYTLQVGDFTGDLKITFEYSGVINDQIEEGAEAVARGFSETSGIIADMGVYLGGSTYWIPSFAEPLFTFNLDVTLPAGWNVVSQGKRTINDEKDGLQLVHYESPNPDEEAYLIAAQFTEYEQMAGNIAVQAFLRTPDEELANRYIGVTSGYLKMYESLLGPYPYTKFALVENFWETGYGMPSFTLLGERVIRLPFILYTSYPHELLHNWWGNSVYVDMQSGNWCEGITAYMADHLMKEQQGQGAEYRQTTLQKFTDYVNSENDFPLVDFRSRNNSAEEAIGYGKCLMMNHMLRKEVGDKLFTEAYRDFYEKHKFTIASYHDIQSSFEAVSGLKLQAFFDQWTLRKGAPDLKLENHQVVNEGDIYQLKFTLKQVQESAPYFINVPVAVYFQDTVILEFVELDTKQQEIEFSYRDKPVRLEVDPQFDVFRRLDKSEVPPALSQLYGSTDGVIILPAKSAYLEDYQQMAETWQKSQVAQGKNLEIITDEDVSQLPENKSVWVLGFENKFAGSFPVTNDYAVFLGDENIAKIDELSQNGSLVFVIPNPNDNAFTYGFVATTVQAAIPGLARLLPHYGKYSYLGFEGDRPNNVLKGAFPALKSPLHQNILYDGRVISSSAKLEPTPPLITQ